jgi:tetratricopeptide (TPR) repeat protein
LAEARQYYEQSLEIDRQIDNRRSIASDLGSLANVLEGMGDLPAATRMQEQALQAFRDVGDLRGEASTLNNLGNVMSDRGELANAKQRFEEAMTVRQQIGYRRGRGFSLFGPSEILQAQDRLANARATTVEAIALRKELKDESGIAQSQMQLAKIALAQGNALGAESLARGAAEEFARQKAVDNACSSNAILGQALLVQGKLKEAQTAGDAAIARCEHGQDRGARFQAAITGAAIKFRAGGTVEARNMLEKAHAEAARSGYVADEMEIRLLMGEVEIKSGRKASGRSRLNTLQKDAQSKQFALTARKARSAIDNGAFEF